jgi:hypothetical protein
LSDEELAQSSCVHWQIEMQSTPCLSWWIVVQPWKAAKAMVMDVLSVTLHAGMLDLVTTQRSQSLVTMGSRGSNLETTVE